ncbi:hypothetical protein HAX54_007569, partial [Datura stramonium]|nr:hypothetical protein [Datura stramonium]
LDPLTQSVANNATQQCFIDKTFNRISIILDGIAKQNHAWNGGDQSEGINVDNLLLSHLMNENQDHDQIMVITLKLTLPKKYKANVVNKKPNKDWG